MVVQDLSLLGKGGGAVSPESRFGGESGQEWGCFGVGESELVGGALREPVGLGCTRMGSGNSSASRGEQPLWDPLAVRKRAQGLQSPRG